MIVRYRSRGGWSWAVLLGLALIVDGIVRVLSLGRYASVLPRLVQIQEGLAVLKRDAARERGD